MYVIINNNDNLDRTRDEPVHITIRAKGSLALNLLAPDWVEMRNDL